MFYKTVFKSLFVSVLFVPAYLAADDIDIYVNSSPSGEAGAPLVMLTVDFRPNAGSSFCGNYQDESCEEAVGSALYPYLVSNIEEFGGYRNTDGVAGLQDGNGSNADDLSVELFDVYRAAVRAVLSDPEMSGMYVGLMAPHGTGCRANEAPRCSNGAYILKGMTLFSEDDFLTQTDPDTSEVSLEIDPNSDRYDLLRRLGSLPKVTGNAAHFYQMREIYYEFFNYLTGGPIVNGYLGWNDFGTDAAQNINNDNAALSWDSSIEAANALYVDPFGDPDAMACSKVYMINTIFNEQQQSESDDAIATSIPDFDFGTGNADSNINENFVRYFNSNDLLDGQNILYPSNRFLDSDGNDFPRTGGNSYTAPDVLGDQSVTSYFITAKGGTNTLNAYASAGDSGYPIQIQDDPAQLVTDIKNVFIDVLKESTTFVAASVPVNVFNRTEVVNNIYFAVFEADSDAQWSGNLKKLRINEEVVGVPQVNDDGTPVLDADNNQVVVQETVFTIVDANGVAAISDDGRIRHNALTLWTDPTGADVVAFDETKDEVTGRDGRSVERGGGGQQIPGFLSGLPGLDNDGDNSRRLFTEVINNFDSTTEPSAVTGQAYALNADAATASVMQNRLGVFNTSEAQTLLEWIRGYNVDAIDYESNPATRPWLLGDPIHSRPIVVNYGGSEDEPNLRIFMGSNDGFIRAFKDSYSSSNYGTEIFGFMPNDVMLNNKGLRADASGDNIYGVDGELVALVDDQDGNGTIAGTDTVYLYSGLRRGGRSYYALDVSSPDNDTVVPNLLWKIKKPIQISGTGDLTGNTAVLSNITTDDGEPIPVGILRGGRLDITGAGLTFDGLPGPGGHATSEDFYHIIDNDEGSITVRGDDDNNDGVEENEFQDAEYSVPFTATVYGNNGFEQLGLTFSTPRVGKIKYGNDKIDVLIFGGGYDPDKDDQGVGPDSEGVAIYIVNADTGALIWKAEGSSAATTATNSTFYHTGMRDSIPAPVTTLDSNGDGIIDRLYVGDTGGNVWRVDLPAAPTVTDESTTQNWRRDNWVVTHLASLGGSDTNDRRFFHAADVVLAKDSSGNRYDGVIINSGDRASPQRDDVDNQLFMIKDRPYATRAQLALRDADPFVPSDLGDITNCLIGTEAACSSDSITNNGWRLPLVENGEKALAAPLTAKGTIFFTSYLPSGEVSDESCAPAEGSSRIYAVKLANGAADLEALNLENASSDNIVRYDEAGDGMAPGATPFGENGVLLPGTGIDDKQIVPLSGKSRWRTYWREIGFDQY